MNVMLGGMWCLMGCDVWWNLVFGGCDFWWMWRLVRCGV